MTVADTGAVTTIDTDSIVFLVTVGIAARGGVLTPVRVERV
jgi:hypothetical protein